MAVAINQIGRHIVKPNKIREFDLVFCDTHRYGTGKFKEFNFFNLIKFTIEIEKVGTLYLFKNRLTGKTKFRLFKIDFRKRKQENK